ncbi:MAG TPA: hypothetical protein VLG11_03945 [Candidatus Saccharimonadales bacterium]|nr:hypothetical protein [Candidatus Saccharimonadales bacterium]
MSFETPAESAPLPRVFNADNLAYSHPASWGSWSVTKQAHTAYGLVPAVQPQEATTVESDGYTPISIALLGPEEVTSLLPQSDDTIAGTFQLGASDNLENPWIAIGATDNIDLGRDYMDALLSGQSGKDLTRAWQEGRFMMEQLVMQGVGHLTMRVAAQEAAQDKAEADGRFRRGAAQMFAGGAAFIADVSATLFVPDKPYITIPFGAMAMAAAVRGTLRAVRATEDGKAAMDRVIVASTIAAARGLGVAHSIHNIYAPTRED